MSRHEGEAAAIRGRLDGFRFFGYALGDMGIAGDRRLAVMNMWDRCVDLMDRPPDNTGRGGIGTRARCCGHIREPLCAVASDHGGAIAIRAAAPRRAGRR